jgi:hypothetical protein
MRFLKPLVRSDRTPRFPLAAGRATGDRGPNPCTGRRRFWRAALALGLLSGLSLSGQERWAPDKPEAGSIEAIARFTTEPRFNNPWVAYVPDSATVPSPTKFLGHLVGAPGELSKTGQIYGYFRALAKASPRVRVETKPASATCPG